jgi:opacity protein-like surface antigen
VIPESTTMNTTAGCLALALAAALPTATQAQAFYAGLDVGSKLDDRFDNFGVVDTDTPFGGHAGWQFHDRWAIELGLTDLGQSTRSAAADAGFDLDGALYQLGVVGNWPIHDRFELLGALGAFRLDEDGTALTLLGPRPLDNSDSGLYLEAGSRFRLDDRWALRASYRWLDLDPDSDGHVVGAVELHW